MKGAKVGIVFSQIASPSVLVAPANFIGLLPSFVIGPATRCDEREHFVAILLLLEASQTIADHHRCLHQNHISVASQLPTLNFFFFFLSPPSIFCDDI